MHSFISLSWNCRDPEVDRRARLIQEKIIKKPFSWVIALEKPGLSALYPPSAVEPRPPVILFRNGTGLIFGTIFRSASLSSSSSLSACTVLSQDEETELLKTEGRSIIRSHWGAYILLMVDQTTSDLLVLRGPMSALPCFWTTISGVTILFSRTEDIANFNIVPLKVNWDSIVAQSVNCANLSRGTGLHGVHTLVSGECLHFSGGVTNRRRYWTPRTASTGVSVSTFQSATELMKQVTQSVINSWCSQHQSILVSLSGGFDSSIVLACAISSPSRPKILATNLYSRRAADERRYAESMAAKYCVPLKEVELPRNVDFRKFLKVKKTANPVLHFSGFATEDTYLRMCNRQNATAVFTGEIGDSVFGHAYGPELLAEAIWRYKLTPKALRVFFDYAILYRLSFWRSLQLALSEYRSYHHSHVAGNADRDSTRSIPLGQRLVTEEAMIHYESTRRQLLHPWFLDIATGPPGWLPVVPGMIMCTSPWMQSAFSYSADTLFLHPLGSQPIIEAFLSIPAPFHISGAENAAVARAAFSSQLSSAVLNRGRGKCTADMWLADIVARNRPFLREFLLGGILTRERILDKSKIEAALSDRQLFSKTRVAELIAQLYIESWLRNWTDSTILDPLKELNVAEQ